MIDCVILFITCTLGALGLGMICGFTVGMFENWMESKYVDHTILTKEKNSGIIEVEKGK